MKKSVILTLLALCSFLGSESLYAQNAVTLWKDGVPTIIYAPDSVFFWNVDNTIPDEANESEAAEPTETEQMIMELSSDEETAVETTYSEEDSIKYDAMAQEILALFAGSEANAAIRLAPRRVKSENDLVEEAIRTNGNNIFDDDLIIEQQDWNSGLWGRTRYGGFETFYNTFMENGRRYLLVVFHYKGGLPNGRTAYLKLGQVNSGKILGMKHMAVAKEYVYLKVCIDDYLPGYGCVNFFPLMITDDSGARNYINPIMVKSKKIVADDWRNQYYGYEFGKINGVSVYFNKDSSKGNNNQGDGGYQCVELCKRYVKELNTNISRKLTDTWGNAINWPSNRANDAKDPNKYIVYANDGKVKVREGDLIVWDYGNYGHIGVVIKTTENYISVAHQNGGTGTNALPIGSTLKIENGIVKDIKPGTNRSPIFATSHPISYFIRMYHSSEEIVSYSATMTASTTNLDFGEVKVGKSITKTFTVTNKGFSTLTISSMSPSKGEAFSVDAENCIIESGETRTFTVTFTPDKTGDLKDRIIIRSDAEDNPMWVIHLTGKGTGGFPTDGLIVMERKYMVDSRKDTSLSDSYAYQSLSLVFDNENSLQIGYLNADYWDNSYNLSRQGVYIISYQGGKKMKEWYIEPRRNGTWVDEKIVIDAVGNVRYYSDGNFMGEELFAELELDKATNVVVNINPYGWWYTHYHYMDDFKLTTPATVVFDNFDDGVFDTDIWQQPLHPDVVREEDGIMKTEQIKTDWNFQLNSNPIPLY